ncbi:phosphatase PAP2 family protein [Streptomyces chumphonensis]|uniref:phosphatase PAP2 family protein n=1 Tax=Streptomyces chumphonensis TaxID=1214925 RepID=UPI0029641873|nr:phosphatase PAP2 family protein [Streptomyces chumphonensis]
MLVTAVGCLLLLAVLSLQVAVPGPLLDADERLSRAWRQTDPRSPAAAGTPAEWGADLGHVHVAVPVLLVALVLAYVRGRRLLPPAAALAAMAAVPLLVLPLKALFDRAGPLGGEGYFPSGHAATAAVGYGAAALVLLPLLRRAGARRALGATAALLTLWVGAGLVRRAYHWPLDVVASWCLGGLLLAGVAAAVNASHPPARRRRRDEDFVPHGGGDGRSDDGRRGGPDDV